MVDNRSTAVAPERPVFPVTFRNSPHAPHWSGVGARRVLRPIQGWMAAVAFVLSSMLLPSNALDMTRLIQTAQRLGPGAAQRTQAMLDLMQAERSADEFDRLRAMNDFFNRSIQFEDDRENWGVVDHWTSPIELLNRGQGDCEDYAIAKYFSLIAMGVAPAKMRMVYVRAQVGGTIQAHMVLAYYPEPSAEPLILDNLISDLRPASRRPDLAPVFSFNAEGLWQGVGSATAGDPVARLSKWRDVLSKAKAEGWW